MTKHIAEATSSWKTRSGLLLALLVALIGTVFTVRQQAEASFIVGTATLVCDQTPNTGPVAIGSNVTYVCTITNSAPTDGAAFPTVNVDIDDDLTIVSTVGTGEFSGCADTSDPVACTASANLNAGSETITITATVDSSALTGGGISLPTSNVTDDAGAGTAVITGTNAAGDAALAIIGVSGPANATNVIGEPHTFTWTLPPGFTCESDVSTGDGVRACVLADVTVLNAGGATATIQAGPIVADPNDANTSAVTVTILSNTAGTATVTLATHFDFGDGFTETANLSAVKTYQTVAQFLGTSVIRHYDVDAGSERAADCDGDASGGGLLLGNDCDVDLGAGVFAPNTNTDLDQIEDDDDAIGSLHTACIVTGPLTHTAHAGFITWNIEDTELNPTVDVGQEISGDDLPVPITGLKADAPCFQWASAAVGDQTIEAVFDPDGIVGPIEGVPIRFDPISEAGVPGTQPLIKEWNSIDTTIIVSVSGVVGGDSTPGIDSCNGFCITVDDIADNTGELDNWDTGETATICERDRNAASVLARWCGSRANQDGQTLTITGSLTAAGFVNPTSNRSFIEYTLGSHTTHFNGPIDGAEQVFRFSGCGSLLLENPETGEVFWLESGESATVLSSNYGVGFTFLARDRDGDLDCRPGDDASVEILTSQDIVLTSAEDTAPTERVRVTYFAQQVAKQPILAWAGQRIQLAHNWFGGEEGCLADEVTRDAGVDAQQRIGFPALYARYEIERGDGAFVPFAILGNPEGDDVFHASLGTLFGEAHECTSYAIYEQEFQGQVDIKATLEICFINEIFNGVEAAQIPFFPTVTDEDCIAIGFVYNFLVYYMEFEDITLGAVGGAREHHNGGLFRPTGNINDAATDTKTATANVSADVLLRARVRGWFKTSSLDTEGTNRPALDGKPSGRHVMPDDWLLLAGGDTALLFRPNYDTMLTPGGSLSCGSPDTCDSSPAFGVPVSTANPSVSNDPVVGPFSLLDPGPGNNSVEFGLGDPRETFLPDGQINRWDAPMPPALVTFSFVGETAASTATSSGFLKEADKYLDVYTGQNPYYLQAIPESPIINSQNYLWHTWEGDGYYRFWESVLENRFPNSLASSPHSGTLEFSQIAAAHALDGKIGRILNVYSDNHGEAMVFVNGDYRLTFDECATNVIGGGKHCEPGDKVGTSNVFAVADYPDFKKKPQIASTPVAITWTWGGYKEVTIEAGETDQFKYVVFHALDRDRFCNIPFVQAFTYDLGLNSRFGERPVGGGVNDRAYKAVFEVTAGGDLTFTNTGIPHLVQLSVSLHPVLSSIDALTTVGANDPVESVDFIIDAGDGIIVGTSAGLGVVDPTRRFATGLPTFSTSLNTTIKEFPTLHGSADECQAWIRVSNSLLGILDVIVTAHDDEGDVGFDTIVDFQGTMTYTLSFRWTLLTYAGPTVPVSDALKGTGANAAGNDIFDQVTAVYGWDEGTQQWEGFFPSGVDVPGANDLTSLVTGEAYWIAIKGPGPVTWTVATNVGG